MQTYRHVFTRYVTLSPPPVSVVDVWAGGLDLEFRGTNSRTLTTDRKRGASRPVSSAVRIYAETNKIALYANAVKVLLLVVCALKA